MKSNWFASRYCSLDLCMGGHLWYLHVGLNLFDWRLKWYRETDDDDASLAFWVGPLYFDFSFNRKWEYHCEHGPSDK